MEQINCLWMGRPIGSRTRLGMIERLCITSFLRNGHPVRLWGYGEIDEVPSGVTRADASAILPLYMAKLYSHLAYVADIFRYTLLAQEGGWWSDMDVVCLRPWNTFGDSFVVGWQDDKEMGMGVLRSPVGHPLAADLRQQALDQGVSPRWGATGPELMTRLAAEHKVVGQHKNCFYPLSWREWSLAFDLDNWPVPREEEGVYGIHLWGEKLRRVNVDVEKPFPATCLFEALKRKYLS